jgi:hypothetical protein
MISPSMSQRIVRALAAAEALVDLLAVQLGSSRQHRQHPRVLALGRSRVEQLAALRLDACNGDLQLIRSEVRVAGSQTLT